MIPDNRTLEELAKWKSNRDNYISKLWDFYNGDNQRYYLKRFSGETDTEYNDRVKNAVIENHCKSTVRISVGYLYASGHPVARRCVDEKAHDLMVDNIWVNNNMEEFMLDTGMMSGVTGYAIVGLEFIDKRTGKSFVGGQYSSSDLKKFFTVRYRLLDSSEAIPIGSESDPRRLNGIYVDSLRDNFKGSMMLHSLRGEQIDEKHIVEWIDSENWVKWIDGRQVQMNPDYKKYINKNIYGDISIPFVVLRNPGDPMMIEGEPDHIDVIPLNNELNKLSNDDSNVVDYHSFPILKFLKGAKMPHDFIRKANSVLEFDRDEDATYLVWDNVLDASQKRQDVVRKQISISSMITAISRGDTSGIGQVRSGPALKSMFQSDLIVAYQKRIKALSFEKQLIKATLKMVEIHTGEKFSSYESAITFPDDFIGIDELIKSQSRAIDLASGAKSLEEVLSEIHPELSNEEIGQLVAVNLEYIGKLKGANPGKEVVSPQGKENEQVKR